ncbi:MAG: LysE family transporter [Candidatus Hodarchaeota archaeon]
MSFLEIFLLSFLVALSGSLSPGPLLTYTIYKAIQTGKRAYFIGILIWIGHALLEFALMLILLIGFSPFITDRSVVIIIGLSGGGILIFFGVSLLRDIWLKKIDLKFLTPEGENIEDQDVSELTDLIQQPTLGGVLVSMSNPYWWIWWAVVGLNFMTQFSVGVLNMEFWGFFLGHELGDFLTYVSIATVLGFTNKFLTRKIYLGIIIGCSAFMIIFGLYLAISPILSYDPGITTNLIS